MRSPPKKQTSLAKTKSKWAASFRRPPIGSKLVVAIGVKCVSADPKDLVEGEKDDRTAHLVVRLSGLLWHRA